MLKRSPPAQVIEKSTYYRSNVDYFLCVVGMVMIVEGLPYFVSPSNIKVWIQKLLEMPDSNLRLIGFLLMTAGLGLIYLGRS